MSFTGRSWRFKARIALDAQRRLPRGLALGRGAGPIPATISVTGEHKTVQARIRAYA